MAQTMKSAADAGDAWLTDDVSDSAATELPPAVGNPIVTIVVVAIAVILTIVLLFGMAVFIDCRHQRLRAGGKHDSEGSVFSVRVPKFLRFVSEEDSFVDKMYPEEHTVA